MLDAGDYAAGVSAADEAIGADTALNDPWGVAVDNTNKALALLRAEGPEQARDHLVTVALDVIALEDIELSIGIVELFACTMAELGSATLAAELVGTADVQRDKAGMPRSIPDAEHLNRSILPVKSRTPAAEWASAYQRGTSRAIADEVEVALVGTPTHRLRDAAEASPREEHLKRICVIPPGVGGISFHNTPRRSDVCGAPNLSAEPLLDSPAKSRSRGHEIKAGPRARVVSIVVSGAQPGQYGKHSPVLVGGGMQVQLGHDPGDVALDGAHVDDEVGRRSRAFERPWAISSSTSRSRALSRPSSSARPVLPIRCETTAGSSTVPPARMVCIAWTSTSTSTTRSLSR